MAMVHAIGTALVCLLADVVAPAKTAQPEVLDRIAATVGERPILLSEVRERARPHFIRIDRNDGDAAQKAAARTEVLHDMLLRMIDERLEEEAADKAHVTVDPSEVDAGIKQILAQSNLTMGDLLAEVKRQGISEQDYRDEIRRQVLEGKLIQLRVRSRVRVTDTEARAVYATWVKEETGPDAPLDLRVLVLQLPANAPPAAKKAAETLAQQIAQRAKSGTDFCALIKQHSQDPTTVSTCGSRGPVKRSALQDQLAKVGGALKSGETSAPVFFTDTAGNEAVLVIQRAPAAPVPTYEKAREKMMERAFLETTERERKLWLDELKKGAAIDIRK